LSAVDPDLVIERFCFQHSKELMGPTGFYSRNSGKDNWVNFAGACRVFYVGFEFHV
jgi:hypothetical protein